MHSQSPLHSKGLTMQASLWQKTQQQTHPIILWEWHKNLHCWKLEVPLIIPFPIPCMLEQTKKPMGGG